MWLIFEVKEVGFDGKVEEDVFLFLQVIHYDFIILFELAMLKNFDLFCPETDFDRFVNISDCNSDNISLFLETMNVFVGDFVIDFVNNANHIDYLKLVFLCNVDVL